MDGNSYASLPDTMAKRYYLDPAVYEEEKERIFFKEWICVGHVSQIPETGSFLTAEIADERIVVFRQDDGSSRAFYNVCQHRAHPLVEGCGQRGKITCPYHGWTYSVNGDLIGAPGCHGLAGFKDRNIKLRQVRCELVLGLIFVNLDEHAVPIAQKLGVVVDEIAAAFPRLEEMVLVAEHTQHHHSNWKVTIENFTECYHCPVAHKYLVQNTYSGEAYKVEFDGAIIRHSSKGHRDPAVHGEDFLVWFMWPTFAIELYPLHRCASLRYWIPRGHERCDYVFRWHTLPDLSPEAVQEVIDYAKVHDETTGDEDTALVDQVQVGLRSRGYTGGMLVVKPELNNECENAVAHLQNFYLQQMGPGR